MNIITQSITKRRRWGAVAAAVFFTCVLVMAAALFVAISIALPGISETVWKALLIVCAVAVLFAFAGGWLARGFIAENVDTLVRDWGPLTRSLFASRIQEEDGEQAQALERRR